MFTLVHTYFSDGNKWFCEFRHPVEAPKCKVFVKKHKIVLYVKKKETELWAELQVNSYNFYTYTGIYTRYISKHCKNDNFFLLWKCVIV